MVGFSVDKLVSADSFLALPCDSMGRAVFGNFEYLILSSAPVGENIKPITYSIIKIIPCEDSTHIRVYPSKAIRLHFFRVPGNHTNAGPGTESPFSEFVADGGKSFLIQTDGDLSGSIISSNKPLVVYIGHQCAQVPEKLDFCSILIEQVPPSSSWGFTFFLIPHSFRQSRYRVGTLMNETLMTVTCTTPISRVVKRLPLPKDGMIDRGEWIEFFTPFNNTALPESKSDYCILESEKPVFVMHYSQGSSVNNGNIGKYGAPSMVIVPPQSQFLQSASFSTLGTNVFVFRKTFASIAVRFNFGFDNIVFRTNNKYFQPTNWSRIYCRNGSLCGWGTSVEVDNGLTTIQHNAVGAVIGVLVYGFDEQLAHSHPTGFARLSPQGGI